MTLPGVGNEPFGDSLKGSHRGLFIGVIPSCADLVSKCPTTPFQLPWSLEHASEASATMSWDACSSNLCSFPLAKNGTVLDELQLLVVAQRRLTITKAHAHRLTQRSSVTTRQTWAGLVRQSRMLRCSRLSMHGNPTSRQASRQPRVRALQKGFSRSRM